MASEQVRMPDAGDPPADAGRFAAMLGLAGEKGDEGCGCCWQRAEIASLTPLTEVLEIRTVDATAVVGFFGAGELEIEGELLGGRFDLLPVFGPRRRSAHRPRARA